MAGSFWVKILRCCFVSHTVLELRVTVAVASCGKAGAGLSVWQGARPDRTATPRQPAADRAREW